MNNMYFGQYIGGDLACHEHRFHAVMGIRVRLGRYVNVQAVSRTAAIYEDCRWSPVLVSVLQLCSNLASDLVFSVFFSASVLQVFPSSSLIPLVGAGR